MYVCFCVYYWFLPGKVGVIRFLNQFSDDRQKTTLFVEWFVLKLKIITCTAHICVLPNFTKGSNQVRVLQFTKVFSFMKSARHSFLVCFGLQIFNINALHIHIHNVYMGYLVCASIYY